MNIRCNFKDNKLGRYLQDDYKGWVINFVEENDDETTAEEEAILYSEVLKFLTKIQYMKSFNSLDAIVKLHNDGVLSREDLEESDDEIAIALYNLSDLVSYYM